MECRIKELRKARNMTMQDVADLSAMGKSTIHDMEHGIALPLIHNAYRVAEALRVSVLEVWPNESTSVDDDLPEDGDSVLAMYKGVYDWRRVTYWKDNSRGHFGAIDEPDGKGSQLATHWKYF